MIEYVLGTSGHPLNLRVDELKRGIVRAVEFVNLKMVCVQRYLGVAIDAGASLGYNLASLSAVLREGWINTYEFLVGNDLSHSSHPGRIVCRELFEEADHRH